MSTISKMETPTGQEETAILLEEYEKRIATLQESLKQECHNPHSNDRVIMKEVDRLVKERDDLKRKLGNAELLIEKLKEDVGHWEEDFAMFDRAHEKAINLWRKEHPDAGYTPDMSDLNEWMVGRVEKAEAVKESLTSALRDIKKNVDDWYPQDYVTIRRLVNAALRTAEESSVVGLIDSTPAKQPEDSANTDGDGDILNDIETSLRAKTEVMKWLLESQTLSPELVPAVAASFGPVNIFRGTGVTNRIDICFATRKEALKWGRRKVLVLRFR